MPTKQKYIGNNGRPCHKMTNSRVARKQNGCNKQVNYFGFVNKIG